MIRQHRVYKRKKKQIQPFLLYFHFLKMLLLFHVIDLAFSLHTVEISNIAEYLNMFC